MLSAFKEARDGDGFVLRVYNPAPTPVNGQVYFGETPVQVRRANMEEHNGERLPTDGSTLRDTWLPFRIHTYRLRFDDASSNGREGAGR